MSSAPFIASSTVSTPFSSFIYFCASAVGDASVWASMKSASGCKPFSLAIPALVLRLGLNGLYMSSTSASVFALTRSLSIFSVRLPPFSIRFLTSSFLLSRLRRYVSRSLSSLKSWSSRPPVASFLYREINGIVLPSSISFTVFSTCVFLIPNSSAS